MKLVALRPALQIPINIIYCYANNGLIKRSKQLKPIPLLLWLAIIIAAAARQQQLLTSCVHRRGFELVIIESWPLGPNNCCSCERLLRLALTLAPCTLHMNPIIYYIALSAVAIAFSARELSWNCRWLTARIRNRNFSSADLVAQKLHHTSFGLCHRYLISS